MVGISKFKKDPNYLLKNNALRLVTLIAVNSLLYFYFRPELSEIFMYLVPILLLSTVGITTTSIGLLLGVFIYTYNVGFSSLHLLFTLAALLITFPVTSLYHSAAHQSIKPVWLSRLIGEICGVIHTSSLDEWSIIHHYHHLHADDPQLDPHPPAGLSFFEFAKNTGKQISARFVAQFVEEHGMTDKNKRRLQAVSASILARQLLLTLFWFLATGPQIFVFFFAANVVFKKIHYAWFNWATHVKTENQVTIFNKDKALYRFINLISINLYYHKNHHLRPYLFNPKKFKVSSQDKKESIAS